jgi:hypothetical protein
VLKETINNFKDKKLHLCDTLDDVDSKEGLSKLWNSKIAVNTKRYLNKHLEKP